MMDFVSIHNDKYTEEIHVLKVKDIISMSDMDRNCAPLCVMKEAGINIMTP